MALSFISPLMFSILNFLICVVYPALNTFVYLYKEDIKSLGNTWIKFSMVSQPSHSSLYAHFIVYWIIYLISRFIEHIFYYILVNLVPFYYEMKLLVFFWLGSSYFKGAGYLYMTYIKFLVRELLQIGSNKLESVMDPQIYSQIRDALISITVQRRQVNQSWTHKR